MEETNEIKVTASATIGDKLVAGIPVINPGDCQGKSWLVVIGGHVDPIYFIVEADHFANAFDKFAESEHGHHVIIGDTEREDYGFFLTNGTHVAGKILDHDCWIDLNGKERAEELANPQVSGSGVHYDTDWMSVYGSDQFDAAMPYPCTYHAEHLPAGGVPADQFYQPGDAPVAVESDQDPEENEQQFSSPETT